VSSNGEGDNMVYVFMLLTRLEESVEHRAPSSSIVFTESAESGSAEWTELEILNSGRKKLFRHGRKSSVP
jgi:hypothetical protein